MESLTEHLVFAGGGTAGHLFPGLAVAENLRRHAPQLRITFVGTGKPFEVKHVRGAGFDYATLPCRPFPRRARDAVKFVTTNLSGYYAARRLLSESGVTMVVGLGGYASVPAARAAAKLGIPYLLLEQNAVAGRATRWLAGRATTVCTTFSGLENQLPSTTRVLWTGNPLRRDFLLAQPAPRWLPDYRGRTRRLLVLGGSGGAAVLNLQVPKALYKARAALDGWEIVHQSGERELEAVKHLYKKFALRATVAPFIDNLPKLLSQSNLAISRAGGTTLAELAASGVPAIVLPFPKATDDHQRKNADYYSAAGACQTLDERELNGRLDNHVAKAVVELATNHPLRVRMAAHMARLAKPQATSRVCQEIVSQLTARQLAAV